MLNIIDPTWEPVFKPCYIDQADTSTRNTGLIFFEKNIYSAWPTIVRVDDPGSDLGRLMLVFNSGDLRHVDTANKACVYLMTSIDDGDNWALYKNVFNDITDQQGTPQLHTYQLIHYQDISDYVGIIDDPITRVHHVTNINPIIRQLDWNVLTNNWLISGPWVPVTNRPKCFQLDQTVTDKSLKIKHQPSAPHGPIQIQLSSVHDEIITIHTNTLSNEPHTLSHVQIKKRPVSNPACANGGWVVATELSDKDEGRIYVDKILYKGIIHNCPSIYILFSEPHFVKCNNGTILAMFRNENPDGDTHTSGHVHVETNTGKYQYLGQAIGTIDPIDTQRIINWTDIKLAVDEDSNPIWGHPPHLTKLSNGWILLSYGCRSIPCSINARISKNNGETWGKEITIANNINCLGMHMGYPSSVELADGSILTVFYKQIPEPWPTPNDQTSSKDTDKTGIWATQWRLPG